MNLGNSKKWPDHSGLRCSSPGGANEPSPGAEAPGTIAVRNASPVGGDTNQEHLSPMISSFPTNPLCRTYGASKS
jgi:hypothetical protein